MYSRNALILHKKEGVSRFIAVKKVEWGNPPPKGMPFTNREPLAREGKCTIRLDKNRYNEADVFNKIEELRRQLVELVQEKGFDNVEVIELSQRLDEYIVLFQSRMNAKSII